MNTATKLRRTSSLLPGIALMSVTTAAMAQNAPPPAYQPDPNAAPPAYQQDPNAAPPAYQQDPNAAPAGAPPPAYASPPPSYAPPPGGPPPGYPPPVAYAPPPPANVHDGFYMRLHIGPGFMSLSSDGDKWTASGASFGVALGGIVAPNLAVFGTLFILETADPDQTSGGVSQGTQNGITIGLGGLGGGVAYYFEPLNLYLSGAIAGVSFQMKDSNNVLPDRNSKTGFGFQGMVGKEWWVTQDWGLGVAAELIAASIKDDPAVSTASYSATTFALLFSATYN